MSIENKKTMLLVEDEAIIAVAQKMTLEKYGYNVITVNSGEKAVEIFRAGSDIDLVLMDIDLGQGSDGTEIAEIILKEREIPVVFLSSHTEPRIVEKTEKITSYGYVVKNSGITVLDASIKMAFKLFYAHENIKSQKMEMESLYEEMEASNEELIALNEEMVISGNEIIESEERFKALHNASFGGIAIHDKGVILECNHGLSDITGYSYDELIGMNGLLLISEKTREKVMNNITSGYEKPYEARGLRKNGEEYPIRLEARNVPYKGKMVRTVEFRDLTEIKKIESTLNSERDRAAKYLDIAGVMVIALNRDGIISLINEKGCEILGAEKDKILGLNWFETFIPGAIRDETKNVFKLVVDGEIGFVDFHENKVINVKGRERIIAWQNTPLYDMDGNLEGVLCSGGDITARKMIEKDLEIKSDQLKIAFIEMEAANEELTSAMQELDAANEELIATAEDLYTKEQALRASEEKFRAIIDTAPVAIHLTTEIEQVTEYINPTMVKLFGYTMEDIPSVAEWWPLAYPDEEYRRKISEEWNKRVKFAIETQTAIEPMEAVVNCKDGSRKNILWGYITLGDNNYSCGLDLTDRIKAEAEVLSLLSEKELLLKEVHHRIKNNMSTISNLLRIQGEDQDNPEIKKVLFDAEGRVLSMMVLYDKLYRSPDFEKMSIANYLPELIDEIISNFPDTLFVKIEKQIDDFILDAKILQSLGIIINELLTNTMKYAFSGRSDCRIKVSAHLSGKNVQITIQDNGKGIPENFDKDKTSGFGMQLVSILTEQIGGHIRIERGEGTRFVIDFFV